MLFKDLRPGFRVYYLRKGSDIEVGEWKIVAVTPPRFPQAGTMQSIQMVVDITVDDNGTNCTYAIPDTLEMAYAGPSLMLSTDRENIVKEIEAVKISLEEDLNKVDERKRKVSQCESILSEWNPIFKEKRDTEARFKSLESTISDLKGMMSGLIKDLKG